MKIREIELSTLLTVGAIIAASAGFVYTSEYRLDNIEQQVEKLEQDQRRLNKKVDRLLRKGAQKK